MVSEIAKKLVVFSSIAIELTGLIVLPKTGYVSRQFIEKFLPAGRTLLVLAGTALRKTWARVLWSARRQGYSLPPDLKSLCRHSARITLPYSVFCGFGAIANAAFAPSVY